MAEPPPGPVKRGEERDSLFGRTKVMLSPCHGFGLAVGVGSREGVRVVKKRGFYLASSPAFPHIRYIRTYAILEEEAEVYRKLVSLEKSRRRLSSEEEKTNRRSSRGRTEIPLSLYHESYLSLESDV